MDDRTPIRVLVVDDEDVFVYALRELLALDDRLVVVAATDNAAHAIELATTSAVDVVLMDMALGGVDGIEATKRIKRVSPDTTILMITGRDRPGTEEAAHRAGATAYLQKGNLGADLADAIVGFAA